MKLNKPIHTTAQLNTTAKQNANNISKNTFGVSFNNLFEVHLKKNKQCFAFFSFTTVFEVTDIIYIHRGNVC